MQGRPEFGEAGRAGQDVHDAGDECGAEELGPRSGAVVEGEPVDTALEGQVEGEPVLEVGGRLDEGLRRTGWPGEFEVLLVEGLQGEGRSLGGGRRRGAGQEGKNDGVSEEKEGTRRADYC